MNFKNPQGQLARWIEMLSSYDFYIEHRPGKFHNNADSLSRIPCRQCKSDHRLAYLSLKQDSDNAFGFTGDVTFSEMHDYDRNLSKVKKWLANKRRPEYNAISGESMTVKSLGLNGID